MPIGEVVYVGREQGSWSVPWDPRISRRHVELHCDGRHLEVKRIPTARNPVFFQGREVDQVTLHPGECFVIGHTTFTFLQQQASIALDAPPPLEEQSFSPQSLRQVTFRNPDHRLEVLTRLPEVISSGGDETERFGRLVNMLMAGAPAADAAAVVAVDCDPASAWEDADIRLLHWDRRLLTSGEFQPSRGLIVEACRLRRSVLHTWEQDDGERSPFTARQDIDWAACTPVILEGRPRWALYLAGAFRRPVLGGSDTTTHDLREDVKFLELVASMLAAVQRIRGLERREAMLSRFLPPVIVESLSREDPEHRLAPRETEVSVIFSDLRGFSLESERCTENLLDLLHRVGQALGVMTRCILEHGGVVGDFQGDAAMGFWGWPLEQDDRVERAARAALAIRRQFEAASRAEEGPLASFQVGMGIASGRAVAGRIGTEHHDKVTVFGPVVNIASRLEGMTKVLRAPILLDETTAAAVRRSVPASVARVRRLAVVKPYGMDTALTVSELLPPAPEHPLLTDEHVMWCDQAVDAFAAGRWDEAFELLHRMPAEDRGTDFLTIHIAQHNRTPPSDWDGAIPLQSK